MGLSASAVADLSLEELRCAKFQVLFRVIFKEPVVVFSGLINIYMSTYSHTGTVQIAKSQRISHFF